MEHRMKRSIIVILVLVTLAMAAGVLVHTGQSPEAGRMAGVDTGTVTYKRIVSMAPNITETLFALGLGERVAGVTRFCVYPPEARKKRKVGGFLDPNYEAIVVLEPDLVLLLPEQERVREYLTELGLYYEVVHNRTVSEILATITTVGSLCRVETRAQELVEDIKKWMDSIRNRNIDALRPRVLITVGRTMGSGSLRDVCITGGNTFYDELIACAGGENAYDGAKIAYPVVSAEGILHMNPEIIIELLPNIKETGLDETDILKDWESLPDIDAVKSGRVFIVQSDYSVVPGPRFILFLEDLARMIHPETLPGKP